jgi:hypothetical protein
MRAEARHVASRAEQARDGVGRDLAGKAAAHGRSLPSRFRRRSRARRAPGDSTTIGFWPTAEGPLSGRRRWTLTFVQQRLEHPRFTRSRR